MAWMLMFSLGVATLWLSPTLFLANSFPLLLLAAVVVFVSAIAVRSYTVTTFKASYRKLFTYLLIYPCVFWLAVGYSHWRVQAALLSKVPLAMDGKSFMLSGRVDNMIVMPASRNNRQGNSIRFDISIDTIADYHKTETARLMKHPERIKNLRFSYYPGDSGKQSFGIGDRLKFCAKLRSPRGQASPGSFDIERWALTQGIDGFGYVTRHCELQQLKHRKRLSLKAIRQAIIDDLQSLLIKHEYGSVLEALLLESGIVFLRRLKQSYSALVRPI